MTELTTVHARVRDANNTYTATARGLRASSTAGAESAAKVLAHKVFPDRAARVEFVSRERAIEVWRITA
jgi:hypothetical protein